MGWMGSAVLQAWPAFQTLADPPKQRHERLMEYIQTRPWEIFKRLASTLWIAGGIWLVWRERTEELPAERVVQSQCLQRFAS